jgi:uncharacterized protein (DUF1810 family)
VRDELDAGTKLTHWMWFVFPQHAALGRSWTAKHFGLASREEALAYWHHPVLGPRLVECCRLVERHARRGAERVFGTVDAMKFRSCLTLFETVAPEERLFAQLLDSFYAGQRDGKTLRLLEADAG